MAESKIHNATRALLQFGSQTLAALSHDNIYTGVTSLNSAVLPFIGTYNSSSVLDIQLNTVWNGSQWIIGMRNPRSDEVTFYVSAHVITI